VTQLLEEITARTAPPSRLQDGERNAATVGTHAHVIGYALSAGHGTTIEVTPVDLPSQGDRTHTTVGIVGVENLFTSASVAAKYNSVAHHSPQHLVGDDFSTVLESFRALMDASDRAVAAYSRVVYPAKCTACWFDTSFFITRFGALRWSRTSHVDLFEGYELYEYSDWDGYGAEPITKETVRAARQILAILPKHFPPPDIAPGADGGIGFEWAFQNGSIRKIFIDIGPGNTWSAYWRLLSGDKGNVPRLDIDASTPQRIDAMFSRLGVVDGSVRR
jgi:hypothetical protein